jgi:hypothetical protein
MAKQSGESYCPVTLDEPVCCISRCIKEPVAEVDADSYASLLECLYGRLRQYRRRRPCDPRLFVCQEHIDDPRLIRASIHWQFLMRLAAPPAGSDR